MFGLDEATTRRLVEGLIDAGVHGMIPTGSTGEFPTLTLDERKRVVEIVVDAARGRVPVVPHTGAMATRDVVGLVCHLDETAVHFFKQPDIPEEAAAAQRAMDVCPTLAVGNDG